MFGSIKDMLVSGFRKLASDTQALKLGMFALVGSILLGVGQGKVYADAYLPFASGSQAGQDVKALGSDLGTSYLMNFIYVVSAFIGVIIAWFVIKAILKRIG